MLEQLGARIRGRREKRNLKQADIANALQVSAQAVSKWERGENAPDIALLGGLCKLLDVSTDWLLGLYEEKQDVFEATVFLSSVRGYAQKSQSLSPRDLAAWANGHFYQMTETILRHDGVVIKQTGDGLLCFFSGPCHERRAVDTALLAKRTMEENVAIALTSGKIYLGSLGHPDYARPDIIGDTVNRAFGVMEYASEGAGSLVMDAVTAAAVDCAKKEKGECKLTYFKKPIRLFTITG